MLCILVAVLCLADELVPEKLADGLGMPDLYAMGSERPISEVVLVVSSNLRKRRAWTMGACVGRRTRPSPVAIASRFLRNGMPLRW